MKKLAIITSHPIQYYAPWFRYLSAQSNLNIKVFYLWNFGVSRQVDIGFQQKISWDIPLLTGYKYDFVENVSSEPGTHHFFGLQNPTLLQQVSTYAPDAILLLSYNYSSVQRFIWSWNCRRIPLLFRGDSHRLLAGSGIKEVTRRQIITQIYQRFAAFLYVGQANYNYFRYHNVAPQKLFFAPHAVDNQRFFSQTHLAQQQAKLWKQELGIPQDHSVILFAGKFEAKKRPLDLLSAFLQANLSKVSLLFVGGGELENELRSHAWNHPHVYFAPFQNQTLMPRTYAAADIVILPSYGSQETWGLVVNEAMCMSRPVIASTHVGCSQDLIKPMQNGLIFPAGDVKALTASLHTAFATRSQLQTWGGESRRIITNYSYAQATQGLHSALTYLNILEPKGIEALAV